MTLPKKHSRPLVVSGECYRYIVSTSRTRDKGTFHLNLTVQIAAGRGQVLKAVGLLTRDFWRDFPEIESPGTYVALRPVHIASIVRRALESGWRPGDANTPFVFSIKAGELGL
jgi:hypothetical protein